jgi:hypothetical protein
LCPHTLVNNDEAGFIDFFQQAVKVFVHFDIGIFDVLDFNICLKLSGKLLKVKAEYLFNITVGLQVIVYFPLFVAAV